MTFHKTVLCMALGAMVAHPSLAETPLSLSMYGVTGLIDMPSADQQSDGTLSIARSQFGPTGRTTLSFQITPRLSGSFRYSSIEHWGSRTAPSTLYDRSFDLRYKLISEGRYLPNLTLGMQDFIGTGVFSGEYIVATKSLGPKLKLTAGLGWGRLGSYNAIGAPFGARSRVAVGLGGNLRTGEWFKGDIAPFGGLEYAVSDKISLKAEYSSDAYSLESGLRKSFDRSSPINFGAEYHTKSGAKLGVYSLYGSQIGFALSFQLDPFRSPTGGQAGPGPLPVRSSAAAQGWSAASLDDPSQLKRLRDQTQAILAADGIVIEALAVTATTAELRIRNTQIDNAPQAIGRAARALATVMPASISRFEIVPVKQGVGLSKVVIARSDLEDLQFDADQSAQSRARAEILPALGPIPAQALRGEGLYPKLTYGFAPYVATSLFDPNAPLQADLGLRLSGRYDIAPGLFVSGAMTKKLAGTIDSKRLSNSIARHKVRSDAALYATQGDPALESLTLAWYAKPTSSLYTRVTAGYLEAMYAGLSTEVLWQQVNKPYALGLELNYVKQRDFNQRFGLQSYSSLTGHISAYYDLRNGYQAQLDVGRYLAGDLGATLSLDREFANGMRVGAFVTKTSMSAKEFGEGSFDKGIRIDLPLAWFIGRPTQKSTGAVLRPITRDGGARLRVNDRLYETISRNQQSELDAAWGRFWK
ncbi:YjbH domain-containing protein [Cypionkella sp.]|uniref:YjbH domain-containing protein n=1 Tax=Cypionkella sp. TaxID=2811411 RepID=UPI003752B9F6